MLGSLIGGFILGRMTGGNSSSHTMSNKEYEKYQRQKNAIEEGRGKSYYWSGYKGKDHPMYAICKKDTNEILACFNTIESAKKFIADMKFVGLHGYNDDFSKWVIRGVFVNDHQTFFYDDFIK